MADKENNNTKTAKDAFLAIRLSGAVMGRLRNEAIRDDRTASAMARHFIIKGIEAREINR